MLRFWPFLGSVQPAALTQEAQGARPRPRDLASSRDTDISELNEVWPRDSGSTASAVRDQGKRKIYDGSSEVTLSLSTIMEYFLHFLIPREMIWNQANVPTKTVVPTL